MTELLEQIKGNRAKLIGHARGVFGITDTATMKAVSQFANADDIIRLIHLKDKGIFNYGATVRTTEYGPKWPQVDVVLRIAAKLEQGEGLTEQDVKDLGLGMEDLPKLLMQSTPKTSKRQTKAASQPPAEPVVEPTSPAPQEQPPVIEETVFMSTTPQNVGNEETLNLLLAEVRAMRQEVNAARQEQVNNAASLSKEIQTLRQELVAAEASGMRQRMIIAGLLDLVLERQGTLAERQVAVGEAILYNFDENASVSAPALPNMSAELDKDLKSAFHAGSSSEEYTFVPEESASSETSTSGPAAVEAESSLPATAGTDDDETLLRDMLSRSISTTNREELVQMCEQLGVKPNAVTMIMKNHIKAEIKRRLGEEGK